MAKMAIKKLAIWTTKSGNLEATREGNERAALCGNLEGEGAGLGRSFPIPEVGHTRSFSGDCIL